jgi:hypothetical protein
MKRRYSSLLFAVLTTPAFDGAVAQSNSNSTSAASATADAVPEVSAPVWAKPDHFWFRRSVPGGHVWLTVDAQHGVKEPLFDHQRLAIELTLRTGVEYSPLTLPFADTAARFVVRYDGSNAYIQEGALAIEFIHGGHLWRCDLQIKWDWNRVPPTDYECLSRRPAPPAQPAPGAGEADAAPRASPDGRWEAFVHDYNVAIRPAGGAAADVTVLTSDGSDGNAYQAGSVRWSADSQTLTAYRVSAEVWLAESVTGNVKRYVARGEWKVPPR